MFALRTQQRCGGIRLSVAAVLARGLTGVDDDSAVYGGLRFGEPRRDVVAEPTADEFGDAVQVCGLLVPQDPDRVALPAKHVLEATETRVPRGFGQEVRPQLLEQGLVDRQSEGHVDDRGMHSALLR